MNSKELFELSENETFLEIGRKAIEDTLIEWRDDRLSSMRNNGFVIKESDGKESNIIRFGPEVGLKIALKAIARKMEEQ